MSMRTALFYAAWLLQACASHTPQTEPAAKGGEPAQTQPPPAPADVRVATAPEVTERAAVTAAAGSGASSPSSPSQEPAQVTLAAPAPTVAKPETPAAYGGKGFVVHEWGTNTVVVGSDGVALRGLHHEGDDLPAFVFDRLKQGDVLGFPTVDKMETPVDYFYSDVPRSVSVRIDMPNGVLTQWYPAVASFLPPILNATHGPELYVDPLNDIHYVYGTDACQTKYSQPPSAGVLDWGKVEILARDAAVTLPEAPLDRYTWSYAREVAANPVRVYNPMGRNAKGATLNDPQTERYLFYRGLGRFQPPLRVTSEASTSGEETVRAQGSEPSAGPVWLLRVDASTGAFVRVDPVANQSALEIPLSKLSRARSLDSFVTDLAEELTAALRGTGLYQDEALAMINTWRKQWFLTPGVRLLYFAPTSWLERELPLTISPAPDLTTRVMVMRVELLTHAVEVADMDAVLQLGSPANLAAGRAYYAALGRFAEPRLRRARSLLGGRAPVESETLLRELEGPNVLSTLAE